jgi:hypothetical protein
MKKIFLSLLCIVFVLSAFASCNQAEESKTEISVIVSETASQTESELSAEISENETVERDEISIVDIVCNFEGKYYALALETIYMDETYIYTLSSYCSQDIIVTYSDGTTQNVKEALEDGNVTLADLDRFEIKYSKREKPTEDRGA